MSEPKERNEEEGVSLTEEETKVPPVAIVRLGAGSILTPGSQELSVSLFAIF